MCARRRVAYALGPDRERERGGGGEMCAEFSSMKVKVPFPSLLFMASLFIVKLISYYQICFYHFDRLSGVAGG